MHSLTPDGDTGLLPLPGYPGRRVKIVTYFSLNGKGGLNPSLVTASRATVASTRTAPEGHQGLIKNSRGNGFDVSDIPYGIPGLLSQILCAKAQ